MDSYVQSDDGLEHVVYVYRGDQPRIGVLAGPLDNARADARLIAAAPALLEAAKGVDVLYVELHCALPEIVGTPGFDRVVAAVEQARAAIRAARGEG